MKSQSKSSMDLAALHFEQQKDWANWLAENYSSSPGIWLQLAKKGAGIQSVSYDEAVDVALCFGWIDGQKKTYSEQFWLQKFIRRSDKSVWPKINKGKALALIKEGKMKPSGLQEVDRAKSDGRWDAAYDSASTSTVPIQTAKKVETRAKKIAEFVRMLERQEKLHA